MRSKCSKGESSYKYGAKTKVKKVQRRSKKALPKEIDHETKKTNNYDAKGRIPNISDRTPDNIANTYGSERNSELKAKKMILINPNLLLTDRDRPPVDSLLDDLEIRMNNILGDRTISSNEKVVQFSRILGDYKNFWENNRKERKPEARDRKEEEEEEQEEEESPPILESDPILQQIPKSYKLKAANIIKRLKSADFSWNRSNNLMKDGRVMHYNFIELLRYSVNRSTRAEEPQDYKRYVNLLRLYNIPVKTKRSSQKGMGWLKLN